jgi:putative toxin-antitoxin system antitoxin component (TIGR02293 family)
MEKRKRKKASYQDLATKDKLQVSELIETYTKTNHLEKMVPDSLFPIIDPSKAHMTYKEFNKILNQLPFLTGEWAYFLGISERTLQRYEASNGQFSILQTERIQHIKELGDIAEKFFGKNKSPFYQWATSKIFSLNNQRPLDLMTTYKGTEMCMSILQNTMYGGVA